MKKRIPLVFLFCMLLWSAGYAQTVGFICMYNGDAPSGAADITAALETEIFEQCFDHGIITTSVEYSVGKASLYTDTASLIKFFDSSVDYVVAVYCEYRIGKEAHTKSQKPVLEWKKLQWKMIDFASQTIVFEDEIDPIVFGDTELKEKAQNAGMHIGATVLKKV